MGRSQALIGSIATPSQRRTIDRGTTPRLTSVGYTDRCREVSGRKKQPMRARPGCSMLPPLPSSFKRTVTLLPSGVQITLRCRLRPNYIDPLCLHSLLCCWRLLLLPRFTLTVAELLGRTECLRLFHVPACFAPFRIEPVLQLNTVADGSVSTLLAISLAISAMKTFGLAPRPCLATVLPPRP